MMIKFYNEAYEKILEIENVADVFTSKHGVKVEYIDEKIGRKVTAYVGPSEYNCFRVE